MRAQFLLGHHLQLAHADMPCSALRKIKNCFFPGNIVYCYCYSDQDAALVNMVSKHPKKKSSDSNYRE